MRRYWETETAVRWLTMFLVRRLGGLIYTLKSSGQEALPASGGLILASNHVNVLDVFPLQQVTPRPIFFMAKSELHRNALLDAVLRRLGSFPVRRGRSDKWAFERAEYLIHRGKVLGMFPEGTRSRGNGLRPAKSGVARLALHSHCSVVPVGISGIHGAVGFGRKRINIEIHFGSPIIPRDDEDPVELTDRVMFTIASLLPPNQRGAYAAPPPGFKELAEILKSSTFAGA